MNVATGRAIFVTDLGTLIHQFGLDGIIERAKRGYLNAIWIRIGHGPNQDANLGLRDLATLRTRLAGNGIALWGWHVPYCETMAAADIEAMNVLGWATQSELDGVVVDAERTNNPPRFRGGSAEASHYAEAVAKGLTKAGKGVAFSSHDQPQLHGDLPFAVFLRWIPAACPQIYATTANPTARFRKSEAGYLPLLQPDFVARYRPTGNVSVQSDVAFPSVAICLASIGRFLDLVRGGGYAGHSFWCWDDAPDALWEMLHAAGPVGSLSAATENAMFIDEAYSELNIVQDFVPKGASNRPGTAMTPVSITIHNTDNTSSGANAAAHARYMKGPDAQKRQVSWHFTVDDKFVYQSIPTNEVAWHTANHQGNMTSIGIEICMNPELDIAAAYARAALLTSVIARRSGIQMPSAIFQHHDWSGKNCPIVLRSTPTGWYDFLAATQAKYHELRDVDTIDIVVKGEDGHHV